VLCHPLFCKTGFHFCATCSRSNFTRDRGFPLGIILTFVANAGLNLVLGLVVARFLGPDAFGRYGIATAIAVAVATLLFDWIKLAATRFYSQTTREGAPQVRATLDLAAIGLSLGLTGLAAGLLLGGADLRLSAGLAAATVAATICTGWFDYQTALARARFADGIYARLILLKNVAAFALMAGGAWLWQDASLVLAGLSLSVILALASAHNALKDDHSGLKAAQWPLMHGYLRYGLPLVAANAAFQLIPLLNRSAAAAGADFAEAGRLALAADIGVRLIASLGSAADIYLFQVAVRRDAQEGRHAAHMQVAQNATIVMALLAPTCAGYWLILPAFEALFVPQAFHGAFVAYSTALLPGLFAYGLVQYALNPVFQLDVRTGPITIAALTGLIIDAFLVWFLPPRIGPIGYAWAQSAAMVVTFMLMTGLALHRSPVWPRARDLIIIVLATAVMIAALLPFRHTGSAGLVLPALALSGCMIYIAIILAFNVAGMRDWLRKIRLRR
jgi:O-antigen/teichoic acid export membrane protein